MLSLHLLDCDVKLVIHICTLIYAKCLKNKWTYFKPEEKSLEIIKVLCRPCLNKKDGSLLSIGSIYSLLILCSLQCMSYVP